jgi:hypothetical protein
MIGEKKNTWRKPLNLFTSPLSLLQITKGLDRDRNSVSKLRGRRQTAMAMACPVDNASLLCELYETHKSTFCEE